MAKNYYVDSRGRVKRNTKQPKYPIVLIISGLVMVLFAASLYAYNIYVQKQAETASQEALEAISSGAPTQYDYIGQIDIPSVGISLPVIDSWDGDNDKLDNAPCVFSGSAEEGNLIIMAHNYTAHFGRLENTTVDSEVYLTLLDGTVIPYTVTEISEIDGSDAAAMQAGDWDLTLYTCNYSGSGRVTVRCKLAK